MITITFTWAMFKWAGLVLLLLSFLGLINGALPGHNAGSAWANFLRWATWPLFIIWVAIIMIRGLFL